MFYVILVMMILCDNGIHISLGTWIFTVALTLCWAVCTSYSQRQIDQQKGGDDS